MSDFLDSDKSETPKSPVYKDIVIANMVILAVYTVYAFTSHGGNIMDAVYIAVHVLACIFIAIVASVMSKNEVATGFYLSAGLVLLIGFGSCVGVSVLFPNPQRAY